MSKKKCSKCGTLCSPTARFCIKCRNPLSSRTRQETTCPKGHRMDPSWQSCPFCESTKAPADNPIASSSPGVDRVRTMVEFDPPEVASMPPEMAPIRDVPVDRFATVVSAPVEHDVAMPSAPAGEPRVVAPPPAKPKKAGIDRAKTQVIHAKSKNVKSAMILGVLVSYSHNPSGNAFLIRAGRNILGSSESANIRVKDPSVSEKHAIIGADLKGIFIDDCLSTNGTFVNDQEVEEKHRLSHGDLIRTGNTTWHFAKIEHTPKSS